MKYHIIGGGTFANVRPHLSLAAQAFGATPRLLAEKLIERGINPELHLTKMAGGKHLNTVSDIDNLVSTIVSEKETKVIFMPVAIADFEGDVINPFTGMPDVSNGRLDSGLPHIMQLRTAEKIISKVRKTRKDIFLVGFKTTHGATDEEMFLKGLNLCKTSSVNLVLVNDIQRRMNMIVTPEEAPYCITGDRDKVITELVQMTMLRSNLHFTRSTVIDEPLVRWDSSEVNPILRSVVDHCIDEKAYKPFHGKTVGHFATKVRDGEYLTSIRKSNFNHDLHEKGLVRILTQGDDSVIAHGAKPSVGGQSQRLIFNKNPELDSIVHFHCPLKPGRDISTVSQRAFECGSHECGENTASGLREYADGLHAVMLDKHGPNIVFDSRRVSAEQVNTFIDMNFDLKSSTSEFLRVS